VRGRLVLVRHAEPVDHAGRCVGQLDVALAPGSDAVLGRLSRTAAPPPRLVVASDLRRATDTARPLSARWGAELRLDARLRELAFGEWEGRAWAEVAATDRRALDAWGADWVRRAAPGGETGLALRQRARAALDDLLASTTPTAPVVVVSHAGWIRVAATVLLGEPLADAFVRSIDYARAAIFDVGAAGVAVAAWNVASLAAPSFTGACVPRPALPSARP
jgi:alpha-ribazole phosphatase